MYCMDFHLKLNIYLFIYLNVVEFILNYFSLRLIYQFIKFDYIYFKYKLKLIKYRKQEHRFDSRTLNNTHTKIKKVLSKFE